MSQCIVRTNRYAVAAENANPACNFFGNFLLIESEEPGRTNCHAGTVILA